MRRLFKPSAENEQTEASPPPSPADDPAWLRNRRIRDAELESANAHGQDLAERYGRTDSRPRFAVLGHADGKRRRP